LLVFNGKNVFSLLKIIPDMVSKAFIIYLA